MSRVLTNNVTLAYAVEASLGTQPTSGWKLAEPNAITSFGADVTVVKRDPISKQKQGRKGIVSDLSSKVDFDADLTIEPFVDFIEGFTFSTFNGTAQFMPTAVKAAGIGTGATFDITTAGSDKHVTVATVNAGGSGYVVGNRLTIAGTAVKKAIVKVATLSGSAVASVTIEYAGDYTGNDPAGTGIASADVSSGYVVASGGALASNTLLFARGFATAANNGLVVAGASTAGIHIHVPSLTAETVAGTTNANLTVAGVRGATGDIQVDSSGNIISTILDFTTLGLTVGQSIYVGGTAGTAYAFATAADTGYARVMVIAAHKLTLDKKSVAFTVDNGSAKTIDLYFGRFARNVASDDADYLEKSYQFELGFPDLGGAGIPKYEYAEGNYCNQIDFTLPLTNKATIKFGFIGTDTTPPSVSRATGASSALSPTQKAAFSTASDIARLRLQEHDETGLSTYFKSLSLSLMNNVVPEKTIGTLGATFMNAGNFDVNISAELIFTSSAIIDAIRANDTVTIDFVVANDDGAILVDIPSLTLGGGARNFTMNESVKINLTGTAFMDATLGTSIGVSLFPYIPS